MTEVISFHWDGRGMDAFLADTDAARSFFEILPVTGIARVMGSCVYFETELPIEDEKTVEEVHVGDVVYWRDRLAVCVFFDEDQPPSEVNLLARLDGDPWVWAHIEDGTPITVDRG